MKCKASVWEEIWLVQNGICFMSFSYPSSLSPKRSHFKIRGPRLTRGSYVSAVIVVGLINYSWYPAPQGTPGKFFTLVAKILLKLTCWPNFRLIGPKFAKLFTFLVLAKLINLKIPKSFVLHYFRKGSTWESMLLGFKLYHWYLQNNSV